MVCPYALSTLLSWVPGNDPIRYTVRLRMSARACSTWGRLEADTVTCRRVHTSEARMYSVHLLIQSVGA